MAYTKKGKGTSANIISQQVNIWNDQEILALRIEIDKYISHDDTHINPNTGLTERDVYTKKLHKENPKLLLSILQDPAHYLRKNQYLGDHITTPNNFVMCGRGFGKTFLAAARIRTLCDYGYKSIGVVGATAQDLSRTIIPTIKKAFPANYQPLQHQAMNVLYLPNGGMIYCFSSESNEIRGANLDAIWIDEIVQFCNGNPSSTLEFYHALVPALRGSTEEKPVQTIITSTPKQNSKVFKYFLNLCETDKEWNLTRGSSLDNPHIQKDAKKWNNSFSEKMKRQEVYGEFIESDDTTIWNESLLTRCSIQTVQPFYKFKEIVIALDPAVSTNARSDEFGISVCGSIDEYNEVGETIQVFYVLEDKSGKYLPQQWSQITHELAKKYGARTVVAEKNQGGNLIPSVLNQTRNNLNIVTIHAKDSKYSRAQSISYLYHQGRVRHFKPDNSSLDTLETNMIAFDGKQGGKDDRIDAMVYALTYLSDPQKQNFKQYRDISNLPI